MDLTIALPTVNVNIVATSFRPPTGKVSWALGGVVPFMHKDPMFIYPISYLLPEMLQILSQAKEHRIQPGQSLNCFVAERENDETRLSSQAFLDGYSFQVINSTLGPVVGWRSNRVTDSDVHWTAVLCNRDDLAAAADKIIDYYKSLELRNEGWK
jgi:hypothetical protein